MDKKGFETHIHDELVMRSRSVMAIACFIVLFFSLLDWFVYPQAYNEFLRIRMIWALTFVIGFGISFYRFFRQHVLYIIDVLFAICGIVISYMIYKTDGPRSTYFAGLMLAFQGGYLANPMVIFPHHVIYGIVVIICYNMGIVAHTPDMTWNQIAGANFFLVSAFFAVIIMGLISRNHGYKSYQDQMCLKQATEELATLHQKMERMYQEASEEAKIDPLSGCFNRRHFLKILERKTRSIVGTNVVFYLAMLDLDHFKEINDQFGHAEGDEAIRVISQAIRESLGDEGVVCRYGGDEFLVMLDIRDREKCRAKLEQVVSRIQTLGREKCQKGVHLDLSIGVTRVEGDDHAHALDGVIQEADEALLKAKSVRGEIVFS